MIALPAPRGEVSESILRELSRGVHELIPAAPAVLGHEALADEDLHLALYICYELHYRGLPGVDERWEWEPSLLAQRALLESAFEQALLAAVAPRPPADAGSLDLALREIAAEDDGPPLSRYLEQRGTREQFLEFVVHRSAYNLKEADPHSWAIPRLSGAPKAALVEIQADEYGGGRPARVHAQLFADAMDELGLDARYGAYLEHIPATTLATVNLMSLLGLHRRWRGAIVGHLALFEITSPLPNRRYGNALRRLGWASRASAFFDEHVEADAVHESIASCDLACGLARQEPALAPDILWGARALALLEARFARSLLDSWSVAESSLRIPLPAAAHERIPV